MQPTSSSSFNNHHLQPGPKRPENNAHRRQKLNNDDDENIFINKLSAISYSSLQTKATSSSSSPSSMLDPCGSLELLQFNLQRLLNLQEERKPLLTGCSGNEQRNQTNNIHNHFQSVDRIDSKVQNLLSAVRKVSQKTKIEKENHGSMNNNNNSRALVIIPSYHDALQQHYRMMTMMMNDSKSENKTRTKRNETHKNHQQTERKNKSLTSTSSIQMTDLEAVYFEEQRMKTREQLFEFINNNNKSNDDFIDNNHRHVVELSEIQMGTLKKLSVVHFGNLERNFTKKEKMMMKFKNKKSPFELLFITLLAACMFSPPLAAKSFRLLHEGFCLLAERNNNHQNNDDEDDEVAQQQQQEEDTDKDLFLPAYQVLKHIQTRSRDHDEAAYHSIVLVTSIGNSTNEVDGKVTPEAFEQLVNFLEENI